MALDPALLGEWKRKNKNEYHRFEADGTHFYGTHNTPYWIENAGSTLNINNKTYYQRQSSEDDGIVGHWRDDPNGEDVYYRADGRSVHIFDNEKGIHTGTFSYTTSHLTTYSFRSVMETQSGSMTYHLPFQLPVSASYSIFGNELTMGGQVYTRVTKK